MKKLVAILLAGVLTLGMAVTVFATPSPGGSTNDATTDHELLDNPDGELIVSQDYPTQEEADAAAALRAAPQTKLEEVVGTEEAKGMTLSLCMDVKVVGVGVEPPYTVRFRVPGVTASSKVIVLHYLNGKWQKENPALGRGTVTVTFSSLSPVAIYVDNETVANAGTANGTGTGGTGTTGSSGTTGISPKTGTTPVMAVVVAVAAFAVAGMVVSTRRKQA